MALPGTESGKEWKFDTKNEIGIYVGQAEDLKDGSMIYWPYTKQIQPRMFCWKLNITDKHFMQYYSARLIMRSEPTSFRSVKEAFHDFDKVGPIGVEDIERMNEELEPTSSELLCEGEEDPLTSVYGGEFNPQLNP